MSVTTIREEELRCMKGEEGLVLQGCGGDLDEWVTGINDMLTEEGILLEGTRINDCKSFTHGSVTCLLFPFKDVKLDIGKLAMWRLKHMISLAELGFRITFPIGWAVFWKMTKKQKNS